MSNKVFSYTKRDYEGSRKEGLSKIPEMSNWNWTDLNTSDPGIVILDYIHAITDMMQYYQDHQALEAFITTAKERENIFRLANQLGYDIPSAKGARVSVEFYLNVLYKEPIKIPKYTVVSTETNIQYLTTEDAYIAAGDSEVQVECVQGVLKTELYTGTGESRFTTRNQSILLNYPTIDIDSISIIDNRGRVWEKVNHILFTNEKDRAYQLVLNPDNTISINFGDGKRGIVPQESDILTITYIVNDAEEGKVSANTIYNIISDIVDSEGYTVNLGVVNNEASIGGSSAQSSSEIREIAPGIIKAQDRAVTLKDYEYLARKVDGVLSAKAYDINTNPDLCQYHEVKVVIIPNELSSSAVITERVHEFLRNRMIPPTNLQVLSPSLVPIDIHLTVKAYENYSKSQLEYDITQAVRDYFSNRISEIGENYYPTDLATIIAGITGVKYIVGNIPENVVQISELSLATLGEFSLTII